MYYDWILFLLIWDFLLSQINIYGPQQHGLNVWVVLPKPSWYELWLGSWYEHPLQSICILQYSSKSVWFYPCSYVCDCFKMPKKSQINEYSEIVEYTNYPSE